MWGGPTAPIAGKTLLNSGVLATGITALEVLQQHPKQAWWYSGGGEVLQNVF